jgi:hypothetical protein
VLVAGLLLVSRQLPELGVVSSRFGKVVQVPLPRLSPPVVVATSRGLVTVPERRTAWTPRQPAISYPVFDWGSRRGTLPGALDRVRQETGDEVTPLDFEGSGSVDEAIAWMGGGAWTTPSWLRTTLRSRATPSGTALDLNLFFHWDEWKIVVGIRNQTTVAGYVVNGYFPGLNLELYEFPLYLSRQPMLISPRVSVWSQPQVPADSIQAWGVLGSLTLEVPLQDNLWLWLEGQGKSAGWVADNLAVGPELMFRTGLHWSL